MLWKEEYNVYWSDGPYMYFCSQKGKWKEFANQRKNTQLKEFTAIYNNNKNLQQNVWVTGLKFKLLLCGHTMYVYIGKQVIRQVPHS